MKSTSVPFALLCLLISGSSLAADPATDSPETDVRAAFGEEIVVGAGLVEVPRKRLGTSVTVLDRQEIERRHKTTVLELLRTVPGLAIAQNGGPGKAASVFIRGGNSSHTLVTVDGVRLNDNGTGGFDFADLTVDNLERIEVVRGPQGLVHGSEAVTGSIHLYTRRGDGPPTAWLRAAGGSDGYSRFGAGVHGGDSSFDYSLSVGRVETDGVSAADEARGNDEADPWENLTVSGRAGGAFWGDGRFAVTARHVEGDTSLDGFTFGVGPTDDLNATQARTQTSGSLSFEKPVNARWTQSLTVSRVNEELAGEDPDDFFSNFEIGGETSVIATRADLALADSNTLAVGYRVEKRQAENLGSFDESLYLRSVYAENLWSWNERLDVSIGLRNDDHSVFGDETTYRLAVSARAGDVLRIHGSLATGFKAPTFNDLYFPGFGNPDLQPETSEGLDLGFEWTLADGRLILDVTAFEIQLDDLILFTFPAGFVNVAEATSEGVEAMVDWRPADRFRLRGSYTYNKTEDLASGLPLARRPEHRMTLDLSFDLTEKLLGSLSAVSVSDRIDSDGAEMDDYERVDLSLEYRWSEALRPFARAENLFDEDYREIPGFTTPGRTLVGGLYLEF